MIELRRLDTAQPDFDARLAELLAFESAQDAQVEAAVTRIIADVKVRGDAALLDYTRRFDRVDAKAAAALEIAREDLRAALGRRPGASRRARDGRGSCAHVSERQRGSSWSYVDADGTELGQRVTAIDRVGIYVPGGKAAYPSTVIMNAVPARVAGVREIVMAVPLPAAKEMTWCLPPRRSARSIAFSPWAAPRRSLRSPSERRPVPAVDKIVGPGNAYVATAKRQVFGVVGIDMIAGPSEIVVVCDGATDPDWVAMDLFSQAEHDEIAQAILIATDAAFLDAVAASMERQLADMPRRAIITASLAARGALVKARRPRRRLPDRQPHRSGAPRAFSGGRPAAAAEDENAGAIFLGRHTSEALGDYLRRSQSRSPTSRTARLASLSASTISRNARAS